MTIPVDELDLDDASCSLCGAQFVDEACYLDEFEALFCEPCAASYVNELEQEAKAYASEACKITETLPKFDAEHQFRCSPAEYEMGMKSSNTPNAHLATCRHECTNYDDLIRQYSRSSRSIRDQAYYAAIRDRTDEMLIAEIERIQPDDAHEFYQFESLPV